MGFPQLKSKTSMAMKRILFIHNNQYGSLTDSLKWCEQLHDRYKITYICFDDGKERINTPGVHVIYVPRIGNKKMRGVLLLLFSAIYATFFPGFIFVIYFEKFELLRKLIPFRKLHLDIRTLCVSDDNSVRERVDGEIIHAAKIFNSVSAISSGVIKKINLNKKVFLLPLGADQISSTAKDFLAIRLLYVGTLQNRRIMDTINGVELFIKKYPNTTLTYDIVGSDSSGVELQKIKDYVASIHLGKYIKIHGLVPHNHLQPFFDECNIGVSYVPITDYYQYQPPTKTYEYAFSGLATIATSTISNEEIINQENGILIKDTPQDFCNGIEKIMKMKFDSDTIRETVKEYSWTNIVDKYLIPIIEH